MKIKCDCLTQISKQVLRSPFGVFSVLEKDPGCTSTCVRFEMLFVFTGKKKKKLFKRLSFSIALIKNHCSGILNIKDCI